MNAQDFIHTVENRKAWASDAFDWFVAYQEAGFTEEQAFAIVVANCGRSSISMPAAAPEVLELYSKLSALLDRQAADS